MCLWWNVIIILCFTPTGDSVTRTVHYHIQNFSLTFLVVIGQLMRWLMHPHASESGSYIKASIFLVFTVGVLLLSHPYLHCENNSPQSAFYIDWTKTRLWLGSGKHYIFLPFFRACLTNLCLFRCDFKNFFPYRKSGVKVVYMSSKSK